MNAIVTASNVSKHYGQKAALESINFTIQEGQIVGLIGPNGAGKTSLLRAMLGLADYQGELSVMGCDPKTQRTQMLENVAFIADTAILPSWISVQQLLDYMQAVHPRFSMEKAGLFLSSTNISAGQKVKSLSKGMVTQLHLALVMAIDAKLLVLDEPTLGLDILYRNQFYEQLLNDYFDQSRTILVTTHQVEEIEHVLTDLLFIRQGQLCLQSSMEEMQQQYIQVEVSTDQIAAAKQLQPIAERSVLGGKIMLFEKPEFSQLEGLGSIKNASVSDVFVAKMQANGEV